MLVEGCGGGGGGGGSTGPGPVTPVSSVAITIPTAAPGLGSLGSQVQFGAEARDAGGAALAGRAISWSSSNTAAVAISTSGLATAIANGTSQITASAEGVVSPAVIVTVSQAAAKVVVSPNTVPLNPGDMQQLAAAARDSGGAAITGKTFTWASADQTVATVSTAGLVSALANGSTQISATSDGVTGTASVAVATATAVSFRIDVQPIFTDNCALSGCHSSVAPQQGMDLSLNRSFANIVNVGSTEVPTLFRVAPSDPGSSYMIRKLEGGLGITGDQMPQGGAALPASTIAIIRNWILQGAKNN